jgi:hypothetical protein
MTRLALAAALVLAGLSPAGAHGWYDPACCSNRDCAPIPNTEVEWTPKGWHVIGEDRYFGHGDWGFRRSEDTGWHRCEFPLGSGRTRCLYVPDPGL